MRYLFYIILLVVVLIAGYFVGSRFAESKYEKTILNNYSYVKEISELATLEVSGNTNLKSTNVQNDGSFSNSLKKTFFEKTVNISVPYVAKYGMDMQKGSLRIIKKDSVVEVYLPRPKLLSFEMKLDRMQATNKKGWLTATDENLYTDAQQEFYTESRKQLETNQMNLQRSQDRVCHVLQSYFKSVGLKSRCYFAGGGSKVNVEMK